MSVHRSFYFLLKLYLPVFLILVGIAVVSEVNDISTGDLTRDPTAIFRASPFIGLLSNLGILAWCASVAIVTFTASFLRTRTDRKAEEIFFWASAGLTLVLLVDDLFRLHDFIFPFILHIRQEAFYVLYIFFALAYLWFYWKMVIASRLAGFMMLAFVFWGLAVVLDALFETGQSWHFLVEDGLKFLGIFSWSVFLIRSSFHAVSGATGYLRAPQTVTREVGSVLSVELRR
jgi:hypothetical protein